MPRRRLYGFGMSNGTTLSVARRAPAASRSYPHQAFVETRLAPHFRQMRKDLTRRSRSWAPTGTAKRPRLGLPARTQTTTVRRRKSGGGSRKGIHGGNSGIYVRSARPTSSYMRDASKSLQMISRNAGNTIQCDAGRQETAEIAHRIQDYNDDINNVQEAYQAGMTIAGAYSQRYNRALIESLTVKTQFQNASNAVVKARVFVVTPRADIYYDTATPAGYLTPKEAFLKGLDEVNSTRGTPLADPETQVNVPLTASPLFNTYWKIVQKNNIVLDPGATYTHTLKVQYNTTWRRERYRLQNLTSIKWWDHYIVVQLFGTPAKDTEHGTITTSPGQLFWTQDSHFRWRIADFTRPGRIISNTLTNTVDANVDVLNDDSGTKEDYLQV